MSPVSRRVYTTAIELRSYRNATEDRAAVFEVGGGLVIVVADGVGGQANGAQAAQRVCDIVRSHTPQSPLVDWTTVLLAADCELLRDPGTGQAAAVVISVIGRDVRGASVGDCEAWIIHDTGRARLTNVRKPYLGCGAATPFAFSGHLEDGSTLVAGTDGLFKYIDVVSIGEVALLPDIAEAASKLANLPKGSSGTYYDDVAIALCRRRNL